MNKKTRHESAYDHECQRLERLESALTLDEQSACGRADTDYHADGTRRAKSRSTTQLAPYSPLFLVLKVRVPVLPVLEIGGVPVFGMALISQLYSSCIFLPVLARNRLFFLFCFGCLS